MLWFKKFLALLFVAIFLLNNIANFSSVGHAEVNGSLLDFEAFIKQTEVLDGTAPFDANNEAGNDSGPSNGIVRTFDTITYPLKVTLNSKNSEQLKNIKLKITGTLENGITENRVNARFAVGGKEDLSNGVVSFDMDYTVKETGNSLMIPITVEVLGAENGLQLKPHIKVQVMSVDNTDVTNENLVQTFDQINPIITSGKVNLKARFTTGYTGTGVVRVLYSAYNPNAKKDDSSQIFPASLDFYVTNLPDRSDLRGATFPSGKINYRFDLSGKVAWDQTSLGEEKLDFENRDTPIKIFNYQAIDSVFAKIPGKNTESSELGLTGYNDERSVDSSSPRSYIPKEKWSSSDIGSYTINSVWDSGVTQISKPKITKNNVTYDSSIGDYMIGSTFPVMRSNSTARTSFGENEKAFSTTRFLIHTPNEYYPSRKNNMSRIPNNVFYYLNVTVDSYEDSKGNVIPYSTTAKATLTERNTAPGSFSIQNTFHSTEGKELGTPSPISTSISKGDPTVVVGQDVNMVSQLNFRMTAEGGATVIYKWNTDSFYLSKQNGEAAVKDFLSYGYPTPLGTWIKNGDKHTGAFGIAKQKDNSFSSLTQKQAEDYDWYESYDEAVKHGEVGALKEDVNDVIGEGQIAANDILLKVKTKKIGSVNDQGTPNIIVTAADVYLTADRTTRYRVRSDGTYNNYTQYDESGHLTELQSPVGSAVNFETLGIMNGEVSSSIKTDKTTYFSSDDMTVTVNNLIKLPEEMDFNSLDEKVEMRLKLPKGLDYVIGTGKYGSTKIEPKLELNEDGTSYLTWYDTLSKNNTSLKKVSFQAKIDPVLLPQGNQVGLSIENVINTSLDTRSEDFRTSSRNISVVKIGMVGVSETIKKVMGKRNSDYEIGMRPYTTIQDEANVKALTYVPRNQDENGSVFSGTTFLKQLTLENSNNKNVEIWLNNKYVASSDPNTIDLQSNGWYKYQTGKDVSKVVSIILYVNGSLSSSDTIKLNLLLGTNGNKFGDQYLSKTIVNTGVDYKLPPSSNRVKYSIVADVNLGLRKIRIDTAPADSGLPVTLKLDKEVIYPESNKEPVTLNLYDKDDNVVVSSKNFTMEELPSEISFKVDPKFLKINKKKNYEIRIANVNTDAINVLEGKDRINTDGYTSSEEAITANPQESDKLTYKGVVRTEREVQKEMDLYYETLTIPLKPLDKQKTGYGFELKTEASYTNEVATSYDMKAEAIVDKKLIDSYLDYEQKEDNSTVVPLDITKKTVSADKKNTNFVFELPHVNVEQRTGALFTDKQVTAGDSRIKYPMKDGKRKLYVPIWADLGDYSVYLKLGEPIGANKVSFQIVQPLNVYARMYGTIGSKTLDHDELVLEPVDPKNPFSIGIGKPSGWSDEDVAWLKE